MQNEKGDILRPHTPDKYHPKWHWDFKSGKSPKSGWENYTPDGQLIPKGSIYGKDFNPLLNLPIQNPLDKKGYERLLNEYKKKLEIYKKELKQYNEKIKKQNNSQFMT